MTRQARYRPTTVIGKISLLCCGLLFGVMMAELGARLLGPPVEGGDELHQCDRVLGWKGRPNSSAVLETDGYKHQVSWNSDGMHDREHSREKPPGTFRVLILGDSFVEAQQVEEQQTNHYLLEEALNRAARPDIHFEVISGAIRGWGPAQQLLYYRSIGHTYHPDLVLVLWLPANDLTNVLPYDRLTGSHGTNCYIPYFAICDNQFDPEPWFPAPGFPPTWQTCSPVEKRVSSVLNYLYHYSRLYQHLEPVLARQADRIDYANPYVPWLPPLAEQDTALQYAYRLTGHILTQLAGEAAQAGAKTALVIVPFNVALYSEVEASYQQSLQQTIGAETGLEADTTLPNRTFRQLMGQQNLPVLDLHPRFVDYLRAGGEPLYWPSDPHWNINGNRVAAEMITRWLVEQGLVPGTLP